ncbi:hypothetical protein GTQ99_05690 [Kineococcus sp. T13]|uniref:CARDB domain-containing protein n=1 Tax=Kineococcus vitellinus TaxID=2696565 RepID=UPI00141242FF|nr:CARDB domain-containing protein [Kineococcus vitellinus]NAZ74917.1 hypothetical protein [Kineococcus vitellinus]
MRSSTRNTSRSIGKSIAAAAVAATTAATLSAIGAGPANAAPARPDLTVTALTWTPGGVNAGVPVTFSATVKNTGKAATPAGVIHGVGFQVDGKLVTWSDTFTASLRPGQSTTVTANFGPTQSATWAATQGRHEVLAFVDDAGRIAESNEGNNRTKKTLTVGASTVTGTTMAGVVPTTKLAALPYDTGLATYVTGAGYAACYTAAGTVRAGTETYLGEYGAGNVQYHPNAPFSWSGAGFAPAGATTVTSEPVDLNEIVRWNYGTPPERLTCRADETAAFTRLHATKVTTNRYTLLPGGYYSDKLIGSYTSPISVDMPF